MLTILLDPAPEKEDSANDWEEALTEFVQEWAEKEKPDFMDVSGSCVLGWDEEMMTVMMSLMMLKTQYVMSDDGHNNVESVVITGDGRDDVVQCCV